MERRQLESVAAQYPHLRGMFLVPLGFIAMASGLGNMAWGPFRALWVVPVVYVVSAAACLPIAYFYRRNYGRVQISGKAQLRGAVALALCVPLLVAGSTMDHRLDLPVWGFLGGWAVLMLVSYAASAGLKLHHQVIWGAALVLSLLPVWGGLTPDLKSNLGLVVAGVCVIVTGILDHQTLVRSFGSLRAPTVEA